MSAPKPDFSAIRTAMAAFDPSPRVEPNAMISADQAFFPNGHRGVLDLRRQLVVGNRGMGKSFWTHALFNKDLRKKLSKAYKYPILASTDVVIGFNGSDKISATAPTIDEIINLLESDVKPDLIWRAVFIRIAATHVLSRPATPLDQVIRKLKLDPGFYSATLSEADDKLYDSKRNLIVLFDALERLGRGWIDIRRMTQAILTLSVRLQSFKCIRAKIFMRVDQFADQDLFRFQDSSKIKNDHVDLLWSAPELYGLLLFDLSRDAPARASLEALALREGASDALPRANDWSWIHSEAQARLINGIAGEFMGSSKKRGRVYTWLPLHLSDAANTCSPRSFLMAWQNAAEHHPAPVGKVVDHLGLFEGVRRASRGRLEELYEDYLWIKPALKALRRKFVPMEREQLLEVWEVGHVIATIREDAAADPRRTPVRFLSGDDPSALLSSMHDVGVIEERENGKINVPDIFRVEAEILRKGGVAVPKRQNQSS